MAKRALDFVYEQQRAITAAKELCYGEDVLKRLYEAKTEYELDRILKTARQNLVDEDLKRWKG